LLGSVAMLALVLPAAGVDLGPAERAWIDAHPVIRVAEPLSPPFALAAPGGEVAGIDVDYLASIAAATGLHFQSTAFPSVQAALEEFRAGRFDAVIGIGRSPERAALMLFGKPYAYSPDAIVSRSDSPFLFDIHELGGRRVGLARSSLELMGRFRDEVSDARLVPYETMEEAVLAVQRNEVDAAVTDATIAAYVVKERKLLDLRISGIFETNPDVYLGVRNDWPELVRIVDRATFACTWTLRPSGTM